ncbi:MAG: SAM-dependent methyltransferase, partial [Sphingomonas sp.]
DVIEHIDDDVAALKAMAKRLKPGGRILIAVPAHQWMWSAHDVVNHHKRRYSKGTLTAALAKAGLGWTKLRWFNSLLFPAAVAARVAGKLTGKDDSDDSPPPKALNTAFEAIFRIERHLLGRVPMTPGLSIIVLASPRG